MKNKEQILLGGIDSKLEAEQVAESLGLKVVSMTNGLYEVE